MDTTDGTIGISPQIWLRITPWMAICYRDWLPRVVARGLQGTALPFRYNKLEELKAIIAQHGNQLAAIIMEPLRDHEPNPGFLEGVRSAATACGAVWIIDEITAGFRLCTGGAHLVYGAQPDIAVFGKALSNGFPMGAVIGRGDTMSAAQSTFISSTFLDGQSGASNSSGDREETSR